MKIPVSTVQRFYLFNLSRGKIKQKSDTLHMQAINTDFQPKYLKIKTHSFPIFHNMTKKDFASPHITYKLNPTNFHQYSCYSCHYINTTSN